MSNTAVMNAPAEAGMAKAKPKMSAYKRRKLIKQALVSFCRFILLLLFSLRYGLGKSEGRNE